MRQGVLSYFKICITLCKLFLGERLTGIEEEDLDEEASKEKRGQDSAVNLHDRFLEEKDELMKRLYDSNEMLVKLLSLLALAPKSLKLTFSNNFC